MMIKNYFKIAWRNIVKRRFYSVLNIIGLSIGIVFTLLIAAYVWRELHVNKDLRNAKNMYFLRSEWKDPNLGADITTIGPVAKRLKEDYPTLVANYYRWDGITSVVTKGDKHFRENIQLGDSTLLSMFGFQLLHGDARTALTKPYSVVVTKAIAIKYFGRTDVVGESIGVQSFSNNKHDFLITGVLKDLPENSVINLNRENNNQVFIPANTFSYFPRGDFESWSNYWLPSYIELRDGVTPKDLEKPLAQLIQTNGDQLSRDNLTIQPVALTAYYLNKDNGLVKRMLYALSFAGIFILLMAIINFINISISNSSARIKEIGVRKVMGSMKRHLVIQFLVESIILVFIATALAWIIYPALKPLFGQMIGKDIPPLSSFPAYFIGIPVALVLVLGVLAGLYPAFVLSAMGTIDSLKGKLTTIKEKVWLRKSLGGFQFAIAAFVMIAALVVSKQVAYFFSKGLGYNKEYVVSSQAPRDWSPQGIRNMERVRNEFAKLPQVSNVTFSYEIPNGMNGGQPPVYKAGTDSTSAVPMQAMVTDEHYSDTYQVPLAAGTFFSTAGSFDSSKIVLNETATHVLGWSDPHAAVGQQLRIPQSPVVYTVAGVTKDFHFDRMQAKIQPTIFFHPRLAVTYRYLSFRIRPGQIASSIAAIEKKWAELLPGSSFEYRFMDDVLKSLYKTEIQLRKASYTATVLSLIIALLGVIGIVSLTIQKKTKEVGIRKVLGASVLSIIVIFLKEFIVVLAIAAIIACPLAWWIMQGWLNDYAYRIPLDAIPFIAVIMGLAIITAVLIVLQTFKAGLAKPARSLRTE